MWSNWWILAFESQSMFRAVLHRMKQIHANFGILWYRDASWKKQFFWGGGKRGRSNKMLAIAHTFGLNGACLSYKLKENRQPFTSSYRLHWNMICCNVFLLLHCTKAAWQSITINRKSANKIKCIANFSDFLLVLSFGFIVSSYSTFYGILNHTSTVTLTSLATHHHHHCIYADDFSFHLFTFFFIIYLSRICSLFLFSVDYPFVIFSYSSSIQTNHFLLPSLHGILGIDTSHHLFPSTHLLRLAIICSLLPCRLILHVHFLFCFKTNPSISKIMVYCLSICVCVSISVWVCAFVSYDFHVFSFRLSVDLGIRFYEQCKKCNRYALVTQKYSSSSLQSV